ncbi:MAG: glycosyltransferase family 2 protein [Anaerolineae bacterium]|nr:glycosyltransferase family 2 protein [Anaerolineae bacterium]
MTMLSIVIPAYNEENGIQAIMERVLQTRDSLNAAGVTELELLVVNDGSKDATLHKADELAVQNECVRIINHPHNRGYGAALKTGFSQARGQLVGFLDADGTYPPEYFPQLCTAAINGADLVIGTRMTGEESQMPLTRRLGNVIFATLLNLLGWQHVTDCASGMRVFRKEVLHLLSPLPDGLNLTPVMSTRAVHEGVRMVEVPIPYSERVGRSKLCVIRDGQLFLTSMVWTVLCYNPVRILGMAGLVGVGIAFLAGVALVIARLAGVTTLTPWAVFGLFLGLVSGVAGISLFALGATFNYLVSLFYKEPVHQGLFGRRIFKKPLEYQFGWMGLGGFATGFLVMVVSLALSFTGWDVARLWLYLLGGALINLVGIQLVIYWLLITVLDQLRQREVVVAADLAG